MKNTLSLLLIVSFVVIGIFGFTLFEHGMMDASNNGCGVSTINEAICPTGLRGMTIHHVSALQILTTTVVSPIFSLLLFLASVLITSVSIFLFYKKILFSKLKLLPQHLRDLTIDSLLGQRKFTSWLSLFELSPAL